MYQLAQWLKTTPLAPFALWLQETPLNRLVDSNIWIAPVVQTLHILAIGVAAGSVLMVSLRIYGVAGLSRTLSQTVARYLPWIWAALAVLLVTGLTLIVGEPARELMNPAFWIKMALVLLGIAASLAFQAGVHRNADGSSTLVMRAGAGAILVLWCVIIVLGRWIAYAPT